MDRKFLTQFIIRLRDWFIIIVPQGFNIFNFIFLPLSFFLFDDFFLFAQNR